MALITGAGRGIGREVTTAFSREGASVCCVARSHGEIDQTVKKIKQIGGKAIAISADVTDYESVEHMYKQAVNELGGLDILVINAGVNLERSSIEEGDPELWVNTIHVNLIGAYYTAKLAIPYLKERGSGKIITIGSGQGHHGSPENSSYSCSKAGLWMLTRILAQELLEYNVSVNELIPGPVVTEMTKHVAENNKGVFSIGGEWLKNPEEVVPLALFLAAQSETGPTGQSYSLMGRVR